MIKSAISLFTVLFLIGICSAGEITHGQIVVNITNIKHKQGTLIIALFDSKENYLNKDYRLLKHEVDNNDSTIIFDNIPFGEYAVGVIHDLNGNGDLDKNILGVPTEPFGFSNVSIGFLGPPGFEQTRFKLTVDSVSVNVCLTFNN